MAWLDKFDFCEKKLKAQNALDKTNKSAKVISIAHYTLLFLINFY